nr:RNA-directed DNA polymerase, eukaryota, reverse transcriptase zinc-binding domain protein [Tanacetum cinerariifolium]
MWKKIDQGGGNEALSVQRSTFLKDLQDILSSETSKISQKAKVRWAIEGDENTKYFHGILNKKGLILQSVGSFLTVNGFPTPISEDLKSFVSYDEIKRAMWDCGTNKSPGPDGFSFNLIRKFWNIIYEDVVAATKEFFATVKFPRGCNSSFIALILNIQDAKVVKYFHRISLIGTMYKIIAKIMANRLSLVILDIISEVMDTGLYKGLSINESFTLSHIFYADDVVFVGEWSDSNINNIIHVLQCFFLASGLKINIHKSQLMGIGVSSIEVDNAAKKVGCITFTTPFHYLGVKVGGSTLRKSLWSEVICKLSSRLSKSKLKTLSIGGRPTLIKSVLFAVSLYHISMFKVPKCVSNKMEALQGEKWQKDVVLGRSMDSEDVLKSQFSRLFALESQKDISVAEKMSHSSLAFSFCRMPMVGVEEDQFNNLISCTSAFILPQIEDRWVWSLSSTGDFSVNYARSFIDDKLLPSFDSPTRWVKVIPIKINVFAWRVWQDKLPTPLNLSILTFLPSSALHAIHRWSLLLICFSLVPWRAKFGVKSLGGGSLLIRGVTRIMIGSIVLITLKCQRGLKSFSKACLAL